MTLKELYHIRKVLGDFNDFVSHNGDSDESGIIDEMLSESSKAIDAIESECERIEIRNATSRAKRKILKSNALD